MAGPSGTVKACETVRDEPDTEPIYHCHLRLNFHGALELITFINYLKSPEGIVAALSLLAGILGVCYGGSRYYRYSRSISHSNDPNKSGGNIHVLARNNSQAVIDRTLAANRNNFGINGDVPVKSSPSPMERKKQIDFIQEQVKNELDQLHEIANYFTIKLILNDAKTITNENTEIFLKDSNRTHIHTETAMNEYVNNFNLLTLQYVFEYLNQQEFESWFQGTTFHLQGLKDFDTAIQKYGDVYIKNDWKNFVAKNKAKYIFSRKLTHDRS
ncbi:MAG: hypothetical protein ORN29_01985 [Rhodoferax sp.]|nr:hypothetical protein [Rhodoferax sp.]